MFDRIGFKRIGIPTFVALIGATLVFTAVAAGQTTWYVDDDAPGDPGPGDPSVSDPNENGSQEHPFDAIQEGIDAAVDGDEVVVADGTYTGYGNRDLDYGGKAITVRSENGPENCIIDCEAGPDDWYWGFYFCNNETSSTVLNGLTIMNGYADCGGGIYCYGGASPTIINCIIAGNEAISFGGGIYCRGTTTIVGCTFSENTAGGGGGGAICSDNVIIADCIFSDNMGYYTAGGLYCYGEAVIINCVITNNAGWEYGGGIYCYGETTIDNCVISANAAAYSGGGIYCSGGSPVIRNCMIANNGMPDWGGAVGCVGSSPTFENCTMLGNMVIWIAGGLYCGSGSSVTLINCVITDNTRLGYSGGGGLYCRSSSLIAANCILWGNAGTGGPEIWLYGSALTVSYSDVEAGQAAVEVDAGSTLTWGAGNIDLDPLFVDPDGPDDDPNTWGDNNYRLSGNSPCIDAADNDAVPPWLTTDLDGRLRFTNRIGTPDTGNGTVPIVDMGAYEYQCDGDLTGDGQITLTDLATLLANYGTTTGAAYADGDVDQDSDVDLSDLAALLSAYGTTCE